MTDLISREALIDRINRMWESRQLTNTKHKTFLEILEAEPSIEPKTADSESVTCMNGEKMHDRTTDDLISREAAIDRIEAMMKEIEEIKEIFPTSDAHEFSATEMRDMRWAGMRDSVEIVKGLPSAQPERKKGEWIEDARTYYETLNDRGYFVDQHTPYFVDDIGCPECLAKFSVIDNEAERFKFCPNCGADMRGGE